MSENDVINLKSSTMKIDNPEEHEEFDLTPFWTYLKTPQGHETAQRVIGFFEDIKRISLNKNSSHQSFETAAKYIIIGLIVASVAGLSYFGKLDPTTGMLFGTIVGYFFGRKEDK